MIAVEEKKNTEGRKAKTQSQPVSAGMEATVYNQKGEGAGKVTLPDEIFGLPWNADLVHQVAVSMASNRRSNTAHTKTRGEVRGGGKKPWRQKGTGQARHGSTRSPIWVGGGITHGPRNDKNYFRKINKSMKQKALHTILSKKYRDGEVFFIENVSLPESKTKEAVKILNSISKLPGLPHFKKKTKNAYIISTPNYDRDLVRSFRNIGSIEFSEYRNLNPLALLQYKALVIVNPKDSIGGSATSKYSAKEEKKVDTKKVVKKTTKAKSVAKK